MPQRMSSAYGSAGSVIPVIELAAEITNPIESSHSAIVVVEVADGIIGAVVDKVSDILSSTAIGSNRLGTWARLRPNLQLRNHSAEQGMVCFLSFEQRFGTNQDGSQLPSRLLLFHLPRLSSFKTRSIHEIQREFEHVQSYRNQFRATG
ncbi:chemotaxis signal transduction CheW-like protein (plasmid) [Rhizobium etli bv. phaseoli str. IE4803]|nr:chemotaxis signal transduction CheW-like protein [Rhizobium etli bv. phaseoli str. IE4803]